MCNAAQRRLNGKKMNEKNYLLAGCPVKMNLVGLKGSEVADLAEITRRVVEDGEKWGK